MRLSVPSVTRRRGHVPGSCFTPITCDLHANDEMQSSPPQLQRVVVVDLVVGTPIAFALHIKCNQRQATNFDPSPKGAGLLSKVCAFSVWLTLLGNELVYATRSIVRKCHSARSNGQALGHLGSWEAKIHSTNCQSLNFSLVSAGKVYLTAFLSLRFLRVVALIN